MQPKKKRPSDVNMRAASVLADVIRLSEKPAKFPKAKQPKRAKK
jgi:hypothetical protein